MLFNLFAIGLILIMTSYLASQGTLTAMLGLVSAAFASLLAMGLFESVEGMIAKYKPDYARGVAFLGLFLVAYLILKLAGDNLIPKNIKLPKGVDRGVGAVFGFFAGLLTVGTTVLGIEMLPLHTEILGYDRFGTDSRMIGPAPGVAAEGKNLWLGPENFTMGMWGMASGRSLGGHQSFDAIHPNLADEAYGVRNVVQYGNMQTLDKGLRVTSAALIDSKNPDELKRLTVPEGKVAYVVRCEISGGTDIDAYFRVTPTAVRLVTDKDKQHFPIGYLDKGKKFIPTPLDVGNVADDEPNNNTAIEDWVFQLDPGEKPTYLDIKALSRADLSAITPANAPLAPLAESNYPKKPYKADEGTIMVSVTSGSTPLANVHVMLLRGSPLLKQVPFVINAYDKVTAILQQFTDGTGGWKDPVENNAHYPRQTFVNTLNRLRDPHDSDPKTMAAQLHDQLPLVYIANTKSNPAQNAGILQSLTTDLIKALTSAGTVVINQGDTDASGNITFDETPKGTWVLFAGYKDADKFYMWSPNVEVKPKGKIEPHLDTGKADFTFPPSFGGT